MFRFQLFVNTTTEPRALGFAFKQGVFVDIGVARLAMPNASFASVVVDLVAVDVSHKLKRLIAVLAEQTSEPEPTKHHSHSKESEKQTNGQQEKDVEVHQKPLRV
jgi:hypothetical protein